MRKIVLSALMIAASATAAHAQSSDELPEPEPNSAIRNWAPYSDQQYTGDVTLEQAFAYDQALCRAELSREILAEGEKTRNPGPNGEPREVISDEKAFMSWTANMKRCLDARGWEAIYRPQPMQLTNHRMPEENPIRVHGYALGLNARGEMVYTPKTSPTAWQYERRIPRVGIEKPNGEIHDLTFDPSYVVDTRGQVVEYGTATPVYQTQTTRHGVTVPVTTAVEGRTPRN